MVSRSPSTDASGYGWGCVIHRASGDISFGDYWSTNDMTLNISSKEMKALVNAIRAFPEDIRDSRVDACVDSKVMIGSWESQGGKTSLELVRTTKQLFWEVATRNIQLSLRFVESSSNKADAPSRRLSRNDTRLSQEAFAQVDNAFGGETGHSLDLMALESNVVRGKDNVPLPHFSPSPSPTSRGVNLFAQDLHAVEDMTNPYVFPPFSLIGPVLRLLVNFKRPFSIVVPELTPRSYWWPELMARCSKRICLGEEGDCRVLLAPSKSGYSYLPCPATMWACRVTRF